MTSGLRMEKVSHAYGGVPAVRNFSIDLSAGELGCLLGPSGCGKTTVFRLVAGLEHLQGGEIWLAGEKLGGPGVNMPPQKRKVGVVFQDFALFPHLTVLANVQFGLHDCAESERVDRARRALSDLRVWDLRDRLPHELSGGQKQRVAIARAMAPRPRLLLMDEPFSNLDGRLKEDLLLELGGVFRSNETTVLMITHHMEEAFLFADKMGVMSEGCIQQWGVPREVYQKPVSLAVAQATGRGVALRAWREEKKIFWALGELSDGPAISVGSDSSLKVFVRPEDLELSLGGDHEVVTVHSLANANLVEVQLTSGERLTALTAVEDSIGRGAKVQVRPRKAPHYFLDGKTISPSRSSFP